MRLPYSDLASVPERKVTQYLLNPAHPAGGSKAAFFLRLGFAADDWNSLANELLRVARENEVVEAEGTPYGTRYVVDGTLTVALVTLDRVQVRSLNRRDIPHARELAPA